MGKRITPRKYQGRIELNDYQLQKKREEERMTKKKTEHRKYKIDIR